jgi:hypothetical protein
MDLVSSLEELLLLHRAEVFDISSILSIIALIMWISNIRIGSRLLAYAGVSLLLLSIAAFAGLSCIELHCNYVSQQQHRVSPYFLSGYYSTQY